MGGNALKAVSVRLTNKNFHRMAASCTQALENAFPAGRVKAIEAYRSKADHGDLDVLITAPDYDPYKAAEALEATEVVRNGPVTSVGVRVRENLPAESGNVFQVDLISIAPEAFDYAAAYFSFNDLGNLIGRTAHKMGLAHRHDGLWFYVRDGDYLFREILLTQHYAEALKFMGFDPERFAQGFDTLEDIFLYVSGSKYFNSASFLLDNLNAKSRVRDRKRRTYMLFLDYCEKHPELPAYPYPANKLEWLPLIAQHFPAFQKEYDKALADLEEQRAVKAKFNGEWVSRLTGLRGKELGALMKRFKESFESSEQQRAFILGHSTLDIEVRVRRIQAEMTS